MKLPEAVLFSPIELQRDSSVHCAHVKCGDWRLCFMYTGDF